MKRFYALMKIRARKVRNYISPVFLALLAVSFSLWYISKLNDSYRTDFNVKVSVDGERVDVPCVVEGKGTRLFGYGIYISRRVTIPLSELKYDMVEVAPTAEQALLPDSLRSKEFKVRISPASMEKAISVRFNDLKIVSVGDFADIAVPKND